MQGPAERPATAPASPLGPGQAHSIRRVAVIGAGHSGRAFAFACVTAGFDVTLEDVMPSKLRHAASEYLEHAGAGHLRLALTVEDAVRDADIAVDFVPDDLESKLEIFSLLDRMAPPKTTLLTPTDALSITDLASCVYRPERCFALRGTMPGTVTGTGTTARLLHPEQSSPTALAGVTEFLQSLGSTVTVQLDPDVPMLVKNAGAAEWRFPSSFDAPH